MADVDFNAAVENIFLIEEKQHSESYQEGFRAGRAAGSPEGFHLGYHRGAEIGKELGYYFGIISTQLSDKGETATKKPEKLIAQLKKVKELIEAFPRHNSEEHDILGLLETIRAQYKKACALLKIPANNPYPTSMSF